MPNYRRLYQPGGTYAFTVNLRDRNSKVLTDHVEDLFDAFEHIKRKYPFKMPVWVILPDHMHCIWILPDGDADFSTRWRLIKSRFSRALPKSLDANGNLRTGERGIWQRRFWEHLIRDEKDTENAIEYIHTNPVKHGYVERPEDWEHSSIHTFEGFLE